MTEQKKRYYCIVPGPNGDCPLSRAACGPPALPRGKPGPARVGSVLGAALDTWTDTPLTMWSSPHRDWATCSRHVSRVTWQEDGRGGDTHLRVQEGDEGKRSEGFRDEDIGDLSEL